MSKVTKEQVVEFLENLTLMEASALVKELEEKFGVSAAAPMAMGIAVGGAAAGAAVAEEKTEFTIVLVDHGDKKINVIKEIRGITGLGLKEAKDLVEGCPKEVKADITKDEALKIKDILEKAGAKVEMK